MQYAKPDPQKIEQFREEFGSKLTEFVEANTTPAEQRTIEEALGHCDALLDAAACIMVTLSPLFGQLMAGPNGEYQSVNLAYKVSSVAKKAMYAWLNQLRIQQN